MRRDDHPDRGRESRNCNKKEGIDKASWMKKQGEKRHNTKVKHRKAMKIERKRGSDEKAQADEKSRVARPKSLAADHKSPQSPPIRQG